MLKNELAEELRRWWRFSDFQQPQSSWHEREDFIEKKLPEWIARIEASFAERNGLVILSEEEFDRFEAEMANPPGPSKSILEGQKLIQKLYGKKKAS